MKFILFACLLAVALAIPAPDKDAKTILDERNDQPDGSYSWAFQTDNGIDRSEKGTPGAEGAITKAGEVSFPLGDGQTFTMTFVADENGFQPKITFTGGKRK